MAGSETDALLRQVHEQYADMLWRYVVSIPYDRELARDVVQETLLRAWQRPEILRRPAPQVRAWLVRVARNLALDDLRSARARRDGHPIDERSAVRGDDADAVLDRWLIADAMATLSPEHRRVIRGAHHEGRSVSELAEELGIAPGTVKSRMHYGMRALRLALQERGVTGS